jgi:hypothetical protein
MKPCGQCALNADDTSTYSCVRVYSAEISSYDTSQTDKSYRNPLRNLLLSYAFTPSCAILQVCERVERQRPFAARRERAAPDAHPLVPGPRVDDAPATVGALIEAMAESRHDWLV